ncbi:MAG: hypothetical protein M1817_004256 [Caeruleum heppii]|nr:MAG: hypothetical protein M1817_004256 [Caeruleum heppii]
MEGPKDDLKWFGEGFDGFPKRLPEDSVEYTLYVRDPELVDDAQIRRRLADVQADADKLQWRLLRGHLWQREGFKLDLRFEDGRTYLQGRTNYGDAVDDEWLIVYLLRELSRQHPTLWVRVVDTDGEFLLIEAANALPRWLNPEVAENRVWINKGGLLIIPREPQNTNVTSVDNISRSLSLPDALHFLKTKSESLSHSPLIEEEAFYRLRDYPAHIADSQHHALVVIPRNLAYVLIQRPDYIGPAVEAFYLRDPITLRALQTESRQQIAKLIFPPVDLVEVSIKFTRVMFAQVKSQQFPAPPAWSKVFSEANNTMDEKRAETGMKITSGFEMLVADPQNQDLEIVRQMRRILSTAAKSPLSDKDIKTQGKRDDDDSWLDINFEDFEKELSGTASGATRKQPAGSKSSFGDKAAQENLRKMVERFEDFLNDDAAGPEGAELMDDMDFDDDEDDNGDDDNDDDEDKDVSFDETEFARMMREMMGMPPDSHLVAAESQSREMEMKRIEELGSGSETDEDEAAAMREVMQRMEAELNESGALNLDPTPTKVSATKNAIEGKLAAQDLPREERAGSASDDDEIDIDLNLAKNILESFKSQAGMAGPGGNLMGLLGTPMPRDEGEDVSKRHEKGDGGQGRP